MWLIWVWEQKNTKNDLAMPRARRCTALCTPALSAMLRRFCGIARRKLPPHRLRLNHFYAASADALQEQPNEAWPLQSEAFEQLFGGEPSVKPKYSFIGGSLLPFSARILFVSSNWTLRIWLKLPCSTAMTSKLRPIYFVRLGGFRLARRRDSCF